MALDDSVQHHSQAVFECLAKEAPERLIAMLSVEPDPVLLTYAAEVAGQHLPSEVVVPALLALLKHESALVREGAVYGLAQHEGDSIDDELRTLVADPSPGVRTAAKDILEMR
jgi:HEAT repeat protein